MRGQEAKEASSSTPAYAYHVFLGFRGEDTRKTFTDHLYGSLVRSGFLTFRDDDGIERGENVKSELEKAIKQSMSSIIVFSKDYASSTWCMDELVTILEHEAEFIGDIIAEIGGKLNVPDLKMIARPGGAYLPAKHMNLYLQNSVVEIGTNSTNAYRIEPSSFCSS
ncbi:hypothetical protein RJ640_024891 [Escallonia rubra]|uniref:ADP-ribosyl cyclase/cyclic ADP-ribose hydrolase n=1 Tax=Escallonia rubra TaxID=112253 RepID=A0AA88RKI5_9ASTE|nr:hypothetical protein RJ640_024891 [Escallonia rubra]